MDRVAHRLLDMRHTHETGIDQDLTLACVDPWGRTVDVPTTMSFSPSDPYAVTLTFHAASGDVVWMMARQVLLQGLTSPAGEGDIKIYPSIDENASAVTVLDFSSPSGHLVGHVPTREVQSFVTSTLEIVPAGDESEYLDIDGLAEALLSSAN
jgi:hypothetical protein